MLITRSDPSSADANLAGFRCEVSARYRVPPKVICFESTETAAISNLKKTL